MQDEIQCPNCRSFYTKTTTRQFRLGMTLLFIILAVWCIVSNISDFSGGLVMLAFLFFLLALGFGINYLLIKGNSSVANPVITNGRIKAWVILLVTIF